MSPPTLTALLRELRACQEAWVREGRGTEVDALTQDALRRAAAWAFERAMVAPSGSVVDMPWLSLHRDLMAAYEAWWVLR